MRSVNRRRLLKSRNAVFFPSASAALLLVVCLSFAAALPRQELAKRAEDNGGLSKNSKLSQDQVTGIEQIMNRTASYS